MRSKQFRYLMLMLIILLLGAAVFIIARPWIESRQSLAMQRDLQAIYQTPSSPQQPHPTASVTSTVPAAPTARPTTAVWPTAGESEPTEIQPQFRELLEINDDVIGWIIIPGTMIDYPVVQGDDNKWYLDHDLYGEEDKAGTVFMDYRMTLDGKDRHQILYGHHLRQGTMFTDLMKYKNADFFQKNRRIILDRLDGREVWEIFSVYVTSVDFYYIETRFSDDQAWLDFIKTIQDRSMHDTSVELSAGDQVLTLSTCTYEFDNARFAVHARRVSQP
ncbi:MAG: class B sortase [Eubacteriales bacterium]|nr:class B sortase [Eubacteriales bacterium]